MSIIGFLFSFQGRINRQHYWMSGVLVIIFAASILAVGASTLPSDIRGTESATEIVQKGAPFLVALIASVILCLWVSLATTAKRIHDLGHSASLITPIYLGPVFLAMFGTIGSLLGLIIAFGAGIWFAFFPGASDDNRFGPNPNGTPFGSLPNEQRRSSPTDASPTGASKTGDAGDWTQNALASIDKATAKAKQAAKRTTGENLDLVSSPTRAQRAQAAPHTALTPTRTGFGQRGT